MKELRNFLLAVAATALLAGSPEYMGAQVRRTTTTTRNTNTKSSSQTKSSSSSSQTRSTSQTRSSASTSQSRSSSVVRGNSSNSQVRNSSGSSQVRSSAGGSQMRAGSGSYNGSQARSGSNTTCGTSSDNGSSRTVRRTTSGTNSQVGNSNSDTRRVAQPVRGGFQNSGVVRQQASQSGSNSSNVRRNTNVTKNGLSTVTSQMRTQPGNINSSRSYRGGAYDDFRIDNHSVHRVPPCDRDFIRYHDLHHFYHHGPHYFGYRVEVLPPRYERRRYFGIDYYIYNNVYYRPYRGHYVVCRPPFGIVVNAAVADLAFAVVNFSYYSNVYNTYRAIDANNRYIDQQNRIIAQNNATIMAQNNAIAMNPGMAKTSYEIADRLGLMQSYAYADKDYYYDDGVFYIINEHGRYQTIVPPAGALVQQLPDDYETLVLDGVEYYRVDDTVYRLALVSGVPYLEVLGQMYGNMARKYNKYYAD